MQTQLRQSAEERLKKGTAPVTRGSPIGSQALMLLHSLASSPETAGDALKLLHELQVHQVELDLQHEQNEQQRQQSDEDLRNATTLFDLAPFGYVTLDHNSQLIAANRIAAEWLAPKVGAEMDWSGRRLEDLLSPECKSAVRDMLARLSAGGGLHSCAVQSKAGGGSARAVASAAPDGQVLMAFVPSGLETGN